MVGWLVGVVGGGGTALLINSEPLTVRGLVRIGRDLMDLR